MFDLGWQELFLVAVVAIVIVGPKDLPQALRAIMHFVRKARGLAREFQSGIDELVREAELDDIKRQVNSARRGDYTEHLRNAVDPGGTLTEDFDPRKFNQELLRRVEGDEAARRLDSGDDAPAHDAPGNGPPADAATGNAAASSNRDETVSPAQGPTPAAAQSDSHPTASNGSGDAAGSGLEPEPGVAEEKRTSAREAGGRG